MNLPLKIEWESWVHTCTSIYFRKKIQADARTSQTANAIGRTIKNEKLIDDKLI